MASAWVIEINPDKSQTQRGLFEFTNVATIGDRILLRHDDKGLHGYGVVQVEHFPTPIRKDAVPEEALTTLYVHWLKEFPVESFRSV